MPYAIMRRLIGRCHDTCASLCMQDNLEKPEGSLLKVHLFFCKKCWSYYLQMRAVNEKMKKHIQISSNQVLDANSVTQDINSIVDKYSQD